MAATNSVLVSGRYYGGDIAMQNMAGSKEAECADICWFSAEYEPAGLPLEMADRCWAAAGAIR